MPRWSNLSKVTENREQKQIMEQRKHKYLYLMLSRDKILRSENKQAYFYKKRLPYCFVRKSYIFISKKKSVIYFLKKSCTFSFCTICSSKIYAPVLGDLTILITLEYARPSFEPVCNVATVFFAMVVFYLFNFLMYCHSLETRVVLLQFQSLRSIFLVLSSDVARSTGQTTVLHLSAFKNNLHSIAF